MPSKNSTAVKPWIIADLHANVEDATTGNSYQSIRLHERHLAARGSCASNGTRRAIAVPVTGTTCQKKHGISYGGRRRCQIG